MQYKLDYIKVTQNKLEFYLVKMPASLLTKISYVAVRNKSDEEGAVQRVLNPRRIAGIKDFTLQSGIFPASIVLNWTCNTLKIVKNKIEIDDKTGSAQVIDGQHRVEGIKQALLEKKEIAKMELPVAIYQGLKTQQCADIFLSINTEQKPVSMSLVYDLYGVASDNIVDIAGQRARDIAFSMNEDPESAYFSNIKLPNSSRKKGGIALSAVAAALKPLVESNGTFEQIGLVELEIQKRVLSNYFQVIQKKYGEAWEDKSNPFLFAAGFAALIRFFELKIARYCNNFKSFKPEVIAGIIDMDEQNRLYQEDVKGMGGSVATNAIYEKLCLRFVPEVKSRVSFEV
jgi:DNA sulfur modification protein DndB